MSFNFRQQEHLSRHFRLSFAVDEEALEALHGSLHPQRSSAIRGGFQTISISALMRPSHCDMY